MKLQNWWFYLCVWLIVASELLKVGGLLIMPYGKTLSRNSYQVGLSVNIGKY